MLKLSQPSSDEVKCFVSCPFCPSRNVEHSDKLLTNLVKLNVDELKEKERLNKRNREVTDWSNNN